MKLYSRVTETYITTRTVSVSFAVYDLELGTPAWSGLIIEGVTRPDIYSLFDLCSHFYPYPPPAPLQVVLTKVFSGLAGNMPGKETFSSRISGLLGSGDTLLPPESLGPQIGAVGLSVKTRTPLGVGAEGIPVRIVIDKADDVYFVKVDEAEDLYTQGNFIRSSYVKDGQIYLLNAKPGRYAAIACYKRKSFINEAVSFFSKELIRLTEVTVTGGTIVFMGEYVVDQKVGVKS